MIKSDLHSHTSFCDGNHSPEEMVLSAIQKDVQTIGFSGHSYVDFDDCCMSEENTGLYIREICRLKKKYAGQIEIFCGLEKDFLSNQDIAPFDYVIGSVHYLKIGDEYLTLDYTPEILKNGIDRYFDGDPIALCEAYYEAVGNVAEKTGCDIIGHFDLISKFNESDVIFDHNDPRYINAWKKAVDHLLKYNLPFEINTGAISRGYRSDPYPSKDIREYIRSNGGTFVLNSDSHHKDTIAYRFDDYLSEIADCDGSDDLLRKTRKR